MRDQRKKVVAFEIEQHSAGGWCIKARHADASRVLMSTGWRTFSDAQEEARCLRVAYDLPVVDDEPGDAHA